MKHIIYITLFIALSAQSAWAIGQSGLPADIAKRGSAVNDFVPKGWKILGKAEGDLNKDGIPDAALALALEGEDPSSDTGIKSPRLLVVIFKDKGGMYELSAVSSKAILCGACGGAMGDPFDSLKSERGSLVINHYGGSSQRWGSTYRFRYQDGGWYLIGKTLTTQDSAGLENTSSDHNLITGKFVEETVSDKGDKSTSTKILPKSKLKDLSEFDISTMSQ